MSNQVTLKQLAKELNLSISTVSKALKNSYEINENTIIRVQALAKKLNYRPNRMALSLKNSQTKTIGVIIPNILNYFFSKVLLGIEDEANKNGYQIIICLSNNKYQKELQSLELLSDGSVDGFILSIARETQREKHHSHFKKIIDEGYPIVMFDRVSENVDCDKVIIDDFEAAFNATNYLLNQGRKKIALISTVSKLDIGKQRTNGYKDALKKHSNYKNEPIIIKITDKADYDSAIKALFDKYDNIDGVLTTNNVSAVTAIKIAQQNDCSIPKDIAIIGFSDDQISRLSYPKLSTIDQNAFEIGQKAAKTLIERLALKNKVEYRTAVVKTNLLVRETS
ncbi:LacI family DNA-binding transcriptional regulator [Aureibaculum sp. 2210JD6-5]|uniref:LacI family DNA-binding transcriptional regulator n=1 Tax=Aureibaculum sp. 2210JD6-5 TaxID=3103957 RepID=UPI002AAD0496|nr:LacI family DNA-binding transcriptional regulator [Aureibaculum sp. 2210JD6-5]MDY7396436.1 LacI family DNA-binding transcriptional regulator [Aureibaculum sp. 2210JD6-5]